VKLNQLIKKLLAAQGSSETAGSRDVIVMVEGAEMPYPDVILVEQSEDTIILRAKVFQDEPKGS
jgi:hypothetical protein